MDDTFNVREAVLVNTLGHSIGVLVFALLIYLFLRDWKGSGSGRGLLPTGAATLALIWNLCSLMALAKAGSADDLSSPVAAISFAALSAMPSLLLHISLGTRLPWFRITGYLLSGAAVCIHLVKGFLPMNASLHDVSLLLISAGFGSITLLVALIERFWSTETVNAQHPRSLARTMGTMAFFLFAISLMHFGSLHEPETRFTEVVLHHAGIPLALVILLQEYRFLLLDTFLRFVANAALAMGIIAVGHFLQVRYGLAALAAGDPFIQALVILAAGTTLVIFGYLRTALQNLLTRVVFRRASLDETLQTIRLEAAKARDLNGMSAITGPLVSEYMGTEKWEWRVAPADELHRHPELISDFARWRDSSEANWVEAVMPIWLNQEGCRLLLLGRRHGARRYLSEDLQSLSRIAYVIEEEAERLRSSELKRLVSEAEYRALQAQINPHFLFNSLNALYGTIPREADKARRMVLNLSQIFRYFFRSERSTIPLSEEAAIVRAYLEIEKLRLGDRLTTEIAIPSELMNFQVPVLSIQPLVENAVKHGVATKRGPGWVRLTATGGDGGLKIDVSDSGGCFPYDRPRPDGGKGIGLDNVRQRLRLCYGPSVEIRIISNPDRTSVGFQIPWQSQAVPDESHKTPAHAL